MKELKILRKDDDCFKCAFDAHDLCKMIDEDVQGYQEKGMSIAEAAVTIAGRMNTQRQLLFLGYVMAVREFGFRDEGEPAVTKVYEELAQPASGEPLSFPVYKSDDLFKAILGHDYNEAELKGRILKAASNAEAIDSKTSTLFQQISRYARTPAELALMIYIATQARDAIDNPIKLILDMLKGKK